MRHYGNPAPGGNNISGEHSTDVKPSSDSEGAILFQLSQAQITEDALRYPSWQAWRDAAQAEWDTATDKSQTIEGSIPDDVQAGTPMTGIEIPGLP
jgi:hypothetical protein